ncbi:hypothetical protein D5086_007377 [Populus alba]|uniref:Uncharacterized protein n=1 Tax=Populus alba TaxID=43335 RepID=A0ACC4CN76_POPAL
MRNMASSGSPSKETVTISPFCTDTVDALADVASPRLNRHRYDFPRQVTKYGDGEKGGWELGREFQNAFGSYSNGVKWRLETL